MTAPKQPVGSRSDKSATIKRNTIQCPRKKRSGDEGHDANRTSVPPATQRAQQKDLTKNGTNSEASRRIDGVRPGSKLATIIAQLKQKGGTTIEALSKVTGWQKHSVHGVISGVMRTKMGIAVQTEVKNGIHYYRIAG